MSKKNVLILTVGTGTAGARSNLAQGLCNTIRMIDPRAYGLVPSSSEESQAIADLIAGEFPENFLGKLAAIDLPDNLRCCRLTFQNVIRKARGLLSPGDRLIINPTSGTKQMSVGATLAALDEEMGDIVFTVGARQDGVVKTGMEELAYFDPALYFRERDLRLADSFFRAGGFAAAEKIVRKFKGFEPKLYAYVATIHHWQRFDYAKAAKCCAPYDKMLQCILKRCDESKKPELGILSDIFAWAKFALRTQDAETLVRLVYKAFEYAAHLFLFPEFQKTGAVTSFEELVKKKHPFASSILEKFKGKKNFYKSLSLRNENTHKIRAIDLGPAQAFYDRVLNAVVDIKPTFRPTDLPLDQFEKNRAVGKADAAF